jgi:hypothetical protein
MNRFRLAKLQAFLVPTLPAALTTGSVVACSYDMPITGGGLAGLAVLVVVGSFQRIARQLSASGVNITIAGDRSVQRISRELSVRSVNITIVREMPPARSPR